MVAIGWLIVGSRPCGCRSGKADRVRVVRTGLSHTNRRAVAPKLGHVIASLKTSYHRHGTLDYDPSLLNSAVGQETSLNMACGGGDEEMISSSFSELVAVSVIFW